MSALQQVFPGHGMTEIETAIMARFDQGQHDVTIAGALKLNRRRVRSVIQMYQEGRNDDWEKAARAGSRELLAAIKRLQARAAA